MANEEQLAILRQGVEVWNKWRKVNHDVEVDLSSINLNRKCLVRANFSTANLTGAKFKESFVIYSNFEEANLDGSKFNQANLLHSNFKEASLVDASLWDATFNSSYLSKANLSKANLLDVNLGDADLSKANLNNVNLSNANLRRAELSETDLTCSLLYRADLLDANLTGAKLTGSCIQDWNINSSTKLHDVDCKYVYMHIGEYNNSEQRFEFKDRLPSHRDLKPGEFTERFQIRANIVELIFHEQVNWDAFAHIFGRLKKKYPDAQIDIQGIVKKGGLIVVNVAVSTDIDKPKFENNFFEGYELAIQALESRIADKERLITSHEQQLASKDEQINQLIAKIDPNTQQIINQHFHNQVTGVAGSVAGNQNMQNHPQEDAETPEMGS